MAAVRKVGGAWEVTHYALAVLLSLATIIGFVISATAAGVIARQQLLQATPLVRHDSLVGAVRAVDSAVRDMSDNLLGLNCQAANYPSPFCDRVKRAAVVGPVQTGAARRAP